MTFDTRMIKNRTELTLRGCEHDRLHLHIYDSVISALDTEQRVQSTQR